jgi:hypothetical protein
MPRDAAGNPVASFGRGRLNDDIRKQHASKAIDPKSRPAGHQPDPDAETSMVEDSPEAIEDVVNEHGPATEMHSQHDHGTGMHKVTTHHGDMKHRSTHSSHGDAHAHMGKALGIAAHEKGESKEFEAAEREGAKETIPGLG